MARMPVVFLGHGSPMNAVEHNEFTESWEALGKSLPRPKAVVAVSAHWFTRGLFVADAERPKQVYDMFGFPPELYRVSYPAPGAPELARRTEVLAGARADNSWGLDHGAWAVLCRVFPKADIPVFQLSVDAQASPERQVETGRRLAPLRDEGVLVLCSGNVVHNLGAVDWEMPGGYPWADEFDAYIRGAVQSGNSDAAVRYRNAGSSARMAVPRPDHFYPLLCALGAADPSDAVSVFCDARVLGGLSMTSYRFGA